MVKIKRNIRATGEITLSSMSDVAFLLIIFFLVTSIFLMKDGLHVSMPDKNKPPVLVSPSRILTVEFKKDGSLYIGNKKRGLTEVRAELVKWNAEKPGGVILLKISGDLPYERTITLIDTVKGSGENRFSLKMI